MGDVMFCDICGAETEIRHGVDLRRGVWLCSRCFSTYQSLKEHYSEKGYDKESCLKILKSVVEKHQAREAGVTLK